MIYSRFIKFVNTLLKIENRPAVASLAKLAINDVRTLIGGNLRQISLDTNKQIIPGVTSQLVLKTYVANPIPQGQDWRVSLLHSLFEMRSQNWIVTFDEEDGPKNLEGNVIEEMINRTCTS